MNSFLQFLELPLPQVSIGILFILLFSSFLRLSIIYSVLCYGLGLRHLAGFVCSLALALGVSMFSMSTEIESIFNDVRFNANSDNSAALQQVADSWKSSLDKKIPQDTKKHFIALSEKNSAHVQDPNAWSIIAPAYVVSEIKAALSASLKILLPFLIIDLLVAYIFTALDVKSLDASYLSLCLKLLAFISADGIGLITTSLIS